MLELSGSGYTTQLPLLSKWHLPPKQRLLLSPDFHLPWASLNRMSVSFLLCMYSESVWQQTHVRQADVIKNMVSDLQETEQEAHKSAQAGWIALVLNCPSFLFSDLWSPAGFYCSLSTLTLISGLNQPMYLSVQTGQITMSVMLSPATHCKAYKESTQNFSHSCSPGDRLHRSKGGNWYIGNLKGKRRSMSWFMVKDWELGAAENQAKSKPEV